jgi:hypothetical protein
MAEPLAQVIEPRVTLATDHAIRLEFAFDDSASVVISSGVIDGPFCDYAKTLKSISPVRTAEQAAIIVDPCFWTPALPFLYKLHLDVVVDGRSAELDATVGFKRWECARSSFRLERKRIVLRGAIATRQDDHDLDDARAAECALIVHRPSIEFCREASRRGVALIADYRGSNEIAFRSLPRLAWEPAVMAALVSRGDEGLSRPDWPHIAATVADTDDESRARRPWERILAVELGHGEHPPGWLAVCDKPVIAIRRGVTYADFHEARAACDRLQADLAPEFNLAGYFVTP